MDYFNGIQGVDYFLILNTPKIFTNKSFEDSASVERKYTLFTDEEMQDNQLINLVASFGLILRSSIFSGTMTEEKLKEMVKNYTPKSEEEIELKRIILGN